MQFRSEAMERHQTPEVLDLPVRLTRPYTWLILAAAVAVVAAGVVWAFTGSLRMSVSGQGLLTSPRGSFPVQAVDAGQITDIFVKPGDKVRPGGRVAAVRNGRLETTVQAPVAGRVFSVPVRHGQVVRTGETLAVAEYTGGPADRLVAVLFVPTTEAMAVQDGQRVDLTVKSAAVMSHGVLRGRVAAVDSTLWTRKEVAAFVGDDGLAELLSPAGPVRRVTVELERSPVTASGYVWSTASGPPSAPRARTTVHGAIHKPDIRPIDWILP
ncbi:HlyD family secretion protein [Sinosporangium album]|uniref:HlyD family secretion protein n=1 Tax=Sinosporangium album TaxID=504805 RepID=A0A1G8B4D8_9ACTN|nr:biotin/lipoyl-binding protein [Sinosporangium album]SDH28057.1 HlyD family secretion protein [Sinosporangium album]